MKMKKEKKKRLDKDKSQVKSWTTGCGDMIKENGIKAFKMSFKPLVDWNNWVKKLTEREKNSFSFIKTWRSSWIEIWYLFRGLACDENGECG